MRFTFCVVLLTLLFTFLAMAAAPQKAILVSYPDDTPESEISRAKEAFRAAGGVITHEYRLIKGFAARASANALGIIQTLAAEHGAVVEEDQIVQADGGVRR